MKKLLVFLMITVICFFMISCTEKEETTESESLPAQESVSETETEMAYVPVELYTVEIKQETVEGEAYTANMIYPQVSGYSNAEIEEKVNALIYSYAKKKMETAVANAGSELGIFYDVDSFNVTYKGEKLISALCRGSVSAEGSAYTKNFSFGINIDFERAKLIGFDEIVSYNGFRKDFVDGAFRQTNGYENLLSETTTNDLISQYDPLYSIYPDFYIKSDNGTEKLGVITDTIQVLGFVAEFECKITDKKYMTDYYSGLVD